MPSSQALYDPADIVSRILANYFPDYQRKTPDGKLDPVDPALVGRVVFPSDVPDGCPLATTIRLLTDPDAMNEFIAERTPVEFLASSRTHMRFADELLSTGLAKKRDRAEKEHGFAKFFTVEKKLNEEGVPILRTILDCRAANRCFSDPLPVNLPSLPQLLDTFAHVQEMRTLDLRHWYHQIPIHGGLARWFTVAFGSLRLQWNVLPMGWKWACFIAQSISTYAAAGPDAFSWTELPSTFRVGRVSFAVVYDNIIAGGAHDDLEEAWAQLHSRLREINAVVKEEFVAVNGQSLPALGLEWKPDSEGLAWRLLDKFTTKARQLGETLNGIVSAKAIAAAIGVVAWSRFATKRDLFDLQPMYRRLSAAVAVGGWGVRDTFEQYRGLSALLAQIPALGWQHTSSAVQEVLVFSDAHVSGFGCVGGDPLACRAGAWNRLHPSGDMFYLEVLAAKQAVLTFAAPARNIHLAVDNKALMFALKKRSTACPRSAPILADIAAVMRLNDANIVPGWVSTHLNPADPLSRGKPLDPELLHDAHRHVEWTVPPVPQWGSIWGRVVG